MSDFKVVQLLNPIQINTNIRPTGAYNASTTYGIGDVVSYNNSSYIAIQATIGNLPTNTTYWQLLVSAATNKLSTTARNTTGVTIPAMSVVYFSGVSGNLPTLALSQASSELTSTKTIGITATSIANNANGEVVIFGLADNLDTTAFAAGSALWLSPTVAGGMTVTKPSAPNHMVFIGFCTRSNATSGTIEVKVQDGFELEELHNVAISSVTDNQVLKYDAPNLLWKNETLVKADVGLSNVPNIDATVASNITEDSTHRFVTDTEKSTWNGKENAITVGTTSQYWRGDKTFQTLDKAAIGLNLVDNTSDLGKPISMATQTALNLKADLASPALTGTPTAPTQTALDNSTKIATTAYVYAATLAVTAPDATTTVKGIIKLAGDLAGTANLPTVPGLAGKEPAITATTSADYYRGDKTFQTLNKASVGLSNVPNVDATNRANHTGNQLAATISDFNSAADARVAIGITNHEAAPDPHPQYTTNIESIVNALIFG